ncbi:hypothetical protein [Nocardioides sambongensis]|uniref:hypothetical protein n=1 Tax=Nocardioides sambongensis TaxID=2589074 RepID=UPI001126716B|nr:hypothetical protein [Nocardioides sambongensis]
MTSILRRRVAGAASLLAASALVLSAGLAPADAAPHKAPKKAAATSKLTFDPSAEGSLKVKLSSKRAACIKNRVVVAVIESAPQEFGFTVSGRTDAKGVFVYPPASARGVAADSIRLTAYTPRTKACLPVQSNTYTLAIPARAAAKPKRVKKASVSTTLSITGTKLRVKVDSSRPVCERSRRIVVLSPMVGTPGSAGALIAKTNAKGVLTYDLESLPPSPSD